MRASTSALASAMMSGRCIVRIADSAITSAAVSSPLWASGLQDWATICQECPTFPRQAVAMRMFSVGQAAPTSPTSVLPACRRMFAGSNRWVSVSSGRSRTASYRGP